MSVLTEMFKWWFMGVGLFLVIPVLSALLPWAYAQKIVGQYQSIAMALLDRAMLMQRSHGSLKLKKAVYDGKFGMERIRIRGKPLYFDDPNNMMSTFKNHSFGLCHEDLAIIFDARTAWFGKQYAELVNSGRIRNEGAIKAYFAIPEGLRELVVLGDIKAIAQNAGGPMTVDRIDAYCEKGQAGFNKNRILRNSGLLIAAGAGVGLMFLLRQVAGTGAVDVGGQVADSLPIMLGVF